MNLVDAYCLECFPEMQIRFSEEELEAASSVGSYIFHEDYFCKWVVTSVRSRRDLTRIAGYVEYLASSPNRHLRDLAEIGIIEYFIDKKFRQMAPHLGSESRNLLSRASKRVRVDDDVWVKTNTGNVDGDID